MVATGWPEFVSAARDAVPVFFLWVAGFGGVLVFLVSFMWFLWRQYKAYVKRVGATAAVFMTLWALGVTGTANPSQEEKDQIRACAAQTAEERRVVGEMLTSGEHAASWSPPGSVEGLGGEASEPLRGGAPASTNITMTLTGEDIARGYRLEGVATNYGAFAEMPSNAEVYARWSLRGGRETRFTLDLGDAAFPLGTDLVHRVSVLSGGTLETLRPSAAGSIRAAREWASLVPGVSAFWSADAPDGAKVARWDCVFADRDRTGEYTAEIRLFGCGDFTTRSNEVVKTYRRVNPDDWDSDGIANEVDASPMSHDGDFFGTPNALPTNANPNAYYWLDMSVTGRLGVATVRVTCDGPSDLGNHVLIMRTNEVCHVPLLAGATYAVESDLPIVGSSVSSEYAEIVTNAENRLTVSLPLELTFERVQMRGGSDSYIAHTSPVDVGPRILNVSGGCCSCTPGETGFSWDCLPQCHCGGSGHSLFGAAKWEGYTYPFYWWGRCHCYYEDQTAIDEIESRGVSLEILDASGNAIEWKDPVLVGESVIVEATVGGAEMTVTDFVGLFGGRIRLKAYYVDSDGAHDMVGAAIPISAATTASQGLNVFRVQVASAWLQSNGIVRNADDGIIAKTSIDMASNVEGLSNRCDSDTFDAQTVGLLYGRARGELNMGNELAAIPEGEFNLKTMQSGGAACMVAACGSALSAKKQCQQQADIIYYSGHGTHDTGVLHVMVAPSDVTNHWRDIDTVVFAGCAVLDIGDKANHYADPPSHSANPGLKWLAASGADVLLGYAYTAPRDSQGSVKIVADWCANRTAMGDVDAWMKANDNSAGHNACALRRTGSNSIEYYFFSRDEHSMFGQHLFNSYKLTSENMEVAE